MRGRAVSSGADKVDRRDRRIAIACALGGALVGLAGAVASAQDSVALTPGGNDALSPYETQRVRYIVDGAPFTGSWGSTYIIAPLLKSSRASDPLFNTRAIGAVAISPDALTNVSAAPGSFARWSAPGFGVHPTANSPGASVFMGSFHRQFGVAFGAVGLAATDLVGAVVGQRLTDPSRLFVTRTVAAVSRASAGAPDHATLTLGAIDPAGHLALRADNFNTPPETPGRVLGDVVARVDLAQRTTAVNRLFHSGGANRASDAPATTFLFDQTGVSLSPPSLIPSSMTSTGLPVAGALGFDNRFWTDTQAPTSGHLAPGVMSHRGTSSYSPTTTLGGAGGSFAALGFSMVSSGALDCISLFAVDQTGGVVATRMAHVPAPLTNGAGFFAASPRFIHWKNQTVFRGGNGHAAVGANAAGETVVAATGSDTAAGNFIAVARLGAGEPAWTVAAHLNKLVLNGPAGQQIGRLVSGSTLSPPSPSSMSAPAVDLLGNVYFLGVMQPNLGAPVVALIKAVNTEAGYRLERILSVGQAFHGVNSDSDYEILSLTLGDGDSLSSGSFFSGCLLQRRLPGSSSNPASADAFGGLVVNAVIRYSNSFTHETYDAALFIGPYRASTPVFADINGDGLVTASDLGLLLGAWGTADAAADLNGDGSVNSADLALLLGAWG